MKEVVIVGGVRTPIGRHGGGLKDVTSQDMAARVMREVLKRTQVDPAVIDEVIVGCCGQQSDAANLARVASLMAGIPKEATGYTVQRNCASGQVALTNAYQAIQADDGQVFM